MTTAAPRGKARPRDRTGGDHSALQPSRDIIDSLLIVIIMHRVRIRCECVMMHRVRIRCECGGKHGDEVPRMHAM